MIPSHNRLLSIYACLKWRMYQNNYDISLLKFLFWKKNSKFERMRGCNYSFIIKRALSPYGWPQWNCELALKNEMIASACFKEIQFPNHCKWRSETITVPFICMAASAPLKQLRNFNRNICQMHCLFTIYGCKCCSKKTPYPLRNGWPQPLSWNKERLYSEKKTGSLRLNIVPH